MIWFRSGFQARLENDSDEAGCQFRRGAYVVALLIEFNTLVPLAGRIRVFGFLKKSTNDDRAHSLYVGIVKQARQPSYYLDFGVADTPDGRFDMVLLNAYLLFRRMKAEPDRTSELSQAVFDLMFADMDQNLREMGLGDIGVSHRIKGMIKAFYGRVSAYDDAIDEPGTPRLEDALRRNLYRKTEPSAAQVKIMAQHVRDQVSFLETLDIDAILEGRIDFAPPPSRQEIS